MTKKKRQTEHRFGVFCLAIVLLSNSSAKYQLLDGKTFQVGVRFSELGELCFIVQCRVGDSKAAHHIAWVSFDIGDTSQFVQIASHGGGTAASRHVWHTERYKHPFRRRGISRCG